MSALDELIQKYSLEKINAYTKYPHILNFHKNQQDKMINQLNELPDNYQPFPPHPEKMKIKIQEFIDGECMRIILFSNDFLIGDQNDIVHAYLDRIVTHNCISNVYEGIRDFLSTYTPSEERLIILYGMAYGKTIKNFQRYTNNSASGFKIIDGMTIKLQDVEDILNRTENEINLWRENLQQPFWVNNTLNRFCNTFNLDILSTLDETTLDKIPVNINETLNWLFQYNKSSLMLDNQTKNNNQSNDQQSNDNKENDNKKSLDDFFDSIEDNNQQQTFNQEKKAKKNFLYEKSAGIIIRNEDRSFIRKLKFDSYLKKKANHN